MSVHITGGCPKISEAELSAFEDELKIRFPEDYREFLLAYNGGKPSPGVFDVDIDGFINTTAILRFLCLGSGDFEEYSLRYYFRRYKDKLPTSLLAIATELSANKICISISGSDFGRVYFWDHNWEVTERTPDYENVHFLAESFTAFLDMLYEDPD